MQQPTPPRSFSARAQQYVSAALFLGIHLACLLVFFVRFSWSLVALAAFGYVLRMWGITAGYHRYFSHRSYKTSRPFQFVLAWIGGAAMQHGPLWWASWHRNHHKHADTPRDPHSPSEHGFWHSHVGWFLDGSHDFPDLSNVQDLARFPELRFIDRFPWLPIVAWALGCYAIAGAPGLVWGFVVSTVAVLHGTVLINSLAHVWGTRRFATADDSRNNAFLAVLTLGEGWHNNHHRYMCSTRQGFYPGEIDVSYMVLKGLARLGVVWDLREPPPAVLEEGRQVGGAGECARAAARALDVGAPEEAEL